MKDDEVSFALLVDALHSYLENPVSLKNSSLSPELTL